MNRIEIAALVGMLTASHGAAAKKPAQVIIFGGGTTEAEAKDATQRFNKQRLYEWILLADGFPKVVESKTIEGLKPGFFIAIAGFCPSNSKNAALLRDALSLEFAGPYLRDVKGDFPSSCPKVSPLGERYKAARGAEVTTLPYATRFPSLRWRVSKFPEPRGKGPTIEFTSMTIELEQNGWVLGYLELPGRIEYAPHQSFDMQWSRSCRSTIARFSMWHAECTTIPTPSWVTAAGECACCTKACRVMRYRWGTSSA